MKRKIMIDLLMAVLVVSIVGCGINSTELLSQADQETIVQEDILMEEISEEASSEETISEVNEEQTEEIFLSEQEKNDLKNLINLLTFSSYFFGGGMEGYSYPVNDIEMNIRMIGMTGSFSLADDTYAKYLPPMEMDYENLTGYCNLEDMQGYLKNVFGVENVNLSAYSEGGKVVCSLLGDLILDDTQIDHMTVMQDDTYEIVGTAVVIEAGVYESIFPFQFTAKKNVSSPFGYQIVSITYEEGEVTDNSFEDQISTNGALSEILLNPEKNSAYYPQGEEYKGLYFALIDIDKDGEDEILLGTSDTMDYFGDPIWMTIFNILKYDRSSGEVSDCDGDMIYKPLDANSWHYYDTGMLMTMAEVGNGHTNFWNLITGEFTDTEAVNPDYQSLTSGNEIPIIWCEVNQANIETLISGENVDAVNIIFPYRMYKSNGGSELDFIDDHSVRVSEGGSSHRYDYTIDSMGNIVIDPENEALEGTYNSATDELNFYGIKYRK